MVWSSNENSKTIDTNSLCVTLLFTDDKELEYTDLNATYSLLNQSGDYKITINDDENLYKVLNYQFYKIPYYIQI